MYVVNDVGNVIKAEKLVMCNRSIQQQNGDYEYYAQEWWLPAQIINQFMQFGEPYIVHLENL